MKNTILPAISFILAVTIPSVLPAQSKSLQDLAGGLAGRSEATTIYSAKEFITMNSNQPRVEAVAVKEGKFVAIGTLDEVKRRSERTLKLIRRLMARW